MPTQKTQARERLGALVKHARRMAGMRRQDDLAAATGLSISVISLLERGIKVEDTTLRIVEETLKFPPDSFLDLIEGRTETLPSPGDRRRKSVVEMSRIELFEMAEMIDEVEGQDAADRWLRGALDKQERNRRRLKDQSAQTFDITASEAE